MAVEWSRGFRLGLHGHRRHHPAQVLPGTPAMVMAVMAMATCHKDRKAHGNLMEIYGKKTNNSGYMMLYGYQMAI